MKNEQLRIEHKITIEQILWLLQGKELRVQTEQLDIRLYPPQDIYTFSREDIEKLKREVRFETIEELEKKMDLRVVNFIPKR